MMGERIRVIDDLLEEKNYRYTDLQRIAKDRNVWRSKSSDCYKKSAYTAPLFMGNPSQSCGASPATFTCRPTQVKAPHLNPSQAGRYSIYLPRRDGRLSLPWWLVTYWDGLPVRRQSDTSNNDLIAIRPGVELTIYWSYVQRPLTVTPQSHPEWPVRLMTRKVKTEKDRDRYSPSYPPGAASCLL